MGEGGWGNKSNCDFWAEKENMRLVDHVRMSLAELCYCPIVSFQSRQEVRVWRFVAPLFVSPVAVRGLWQQKSLGFNRFYHSKRSKALKCACALIWKFHST